MFYKVPSYQISGPLKSFSLNFLPLKMEWPAHQMLMYASPLWKDKDKIMSWRAWRSHLGIENKIWHWKIKFCHWKTEIWHWKTCVGIEKRMCCHKKKLGFSIKKIFFGIEKLSFGIETLRFGIENKIWHWKIKNGIENKIGHWKMYVLALKN